jgi:hypothetical protein
MVHAGCWAHARRYFFQALQLNGKDLVALGIVVEIDKLFELEAEAKAAGLGATERLELRRQKAEPIVEALRGRVESAQFAFIRVYSRFLFDRLWSSMISFRSFSGRRSIISG